MLAIKPQKSGVNAALALGLGLTSLVTTLPSPILAQPYYAPYYSQVKTSIVPPGTLIPVTLDQSDKILIGKTESRALTLTVAANLRDRAGNIVIPVGSQIVGQLQPRGRGTQFVARQFSLGKTSNPNWRSINATSQVITTTEVVQQGASAAEILTGTVAGAGTATLLAGLTGDRRIDALEVLGGAAVGALAGWALPASGTLGGSSQEMIAIQPRRDLTLTLQSNLVFDDDTSEVNRSNNLRSVRLRPLTSYRGTPYSASSSRREASFCW